MIVINCGGGGGRKSESTQVPNTDTTSPTVSSTAPANGDTQVAPNSIITATFSEAIDSNTFSNNFIVKILGTSGVASVSGTISYIPDTKTVTFKPDSNLNINTTYSVTLTTNIEDLAGNKMTDLYQWSFSTGAAIDSIPPSFSGNDPQLVAQATSTTSISLSWNAATDNATPTNQIRYLICQSTSSTACNTDPFPQTGSSVVLYEGTAGTLTYGVTGLTSNTLYYFTVRAKDLVDLIDSNTAQKSATTPGNFVSLGGSLNAICTGTLTKTCDKDATSPSIAIAGSTPFVAWQEASNVYVRSFNETTKWSTPVSINSAGTTGQNPSLALDNASPPGLYLTYIECAGSNCNVLVKKNISSTWSSPIGDTISTNKAEKSMIAFTADNTPYVIWAEKDISGITQIYVKHLAGQNWILDGASLNVNQDRFGASAAAEGSNPSIAVSGTTVKAAWSECVANTPDCQLYVKTWDSSNPSVWTPSNPTSLKFGGPIDPSNPNNPSLAYINGILHLAWHEPGKVYLRKDTGGGFGSAEVISSSAQSASNTPVKGTATSTQVPYLVYADTTSTSPTNPPFLFVKRWNGTQWITEGSGPLNMTGGAGSAASMSSAIAFSAGTPYVAWVETGACATNLCQQSNSTNSQLYVKRLQ